MSSDEVKGASQETLWEVARNGYQLCLTDEGGSVSMPKGTTLKVDVLRCCKLFRVGHFYTLSPYFGIIPRVLTIEKNRKRK
ncbi:UNVERIFIED_CONTAM: hypothetical protein NCL1_51017 [Trichonephila clavipes]